MSEINREIIHSYFENLAGKRDRWLKRNRFYHKTLVRHYSLIIPEGARVIELGCGTGDLLSAVKPSVGVGIDFSGNMIAKARGRHAHLTFHTADASDFHTDIKFDYVIMSDLLSSLWDIQ